MKTIPLHVREAAIARIRRQTQIDCIASRRGMPWLLPDGITASDIRTARRRLIRDRAESAWARNTRALGLRLLLQSLARKRRKELTGLRMTSRHGS